VPDDGCLLSHMIVRSYGDSQTHRLCLVPWLVSEEQFSSPLPLRPVNASAASTPKDLRFRMYFHIHSPTIVPAIESMSCVSSLGGAVVAVSGRLVGLLGLEEERMPQSNARDCCSGVGSSGIGNLVGCLGLSKAIDCTGVSLGDLLRRRGFCGDNLPVLPRIETADCTLRKLPCL
jgi:hypothetical protein